MKQSSRHILKDQSASLPPLHAAAAHGDIAVVDGLLAVGEDVFKLDPLMGASVLHFAAQSGSAEIIQLLLDHGALINLQSHSHGMTPLMVAVWHRRPAVARVLLEHADIDPSVRSRLGATAEEMLGDATPQDAELRDIFDDFRTRAEKRRRWQPLIAALGDRTLSPAEKEQRVAELLEAGADPNVVAPNYDIENPGHTPLMIAARDGLAEAVRALLEAGADMTLVDHFMHAHPAHKAAYMGRSDVMRALVAHPRFAEIADIQGPFNGYTALHDAVWMGHADTVAILIDAGVSLAPRGHDGQTAAEMAHAFGFETVRAMLDEASRRRTVPDQLGTAVISPALA